MPNATLDELKATPGIKLVDPLPALQTQEGPTCGFYALSIVMQYWKARTKTETLVAPPARNRDVDHQPEDVKAGLTQTPKPQPEGEAKQRARPAVQSLRSLGGEAARSLGEGQAVHPGGMFDINQIAQVAKAVKGLDGGEQYKVRTYTLNTHDNFQKGICALIDHGIPPIVAFDVAAGDPVTDKGESAHWGVVLGYYVDKEVLWFAATHGHGKYYRWLAKDLTDSNFGLDGGSSETDVWIKGTARPDRSAIQAYLERVNANAPQNLPTAKELLLKLAKMKTRPQWSRAGDKTAPSQATPPVFVVDQPIQTRQVSAVKLKLAYQVLAVSPNLQGQ